MLFRLHCSEFATNNSVYYGTFFYPACTQSDSAPSSFSQQPFNFLSCFFACTVANSPPIIACTMARFFIPRALSPIQLLLIKQWTQMRLSTARNISFYKNDFPFCFNEEWSYNVMCGCCCYLSVRPISLLLRNFVVYWVKINFLILLQVVKRKSKFGILLGHLF